MIGASAVPGAGPVLGPAVAGALTAGQSAMSGQGPLSSLASGAASAGMSYGLGQLGDWMKGAPGTEGVADASQFAGRMSLNGPAQMGLPNDSLTNFALKDLLKRQAARNSFLGGGFL